jgi:hypothetical protein
MAEAPYGDWRPGGEAGSPGDDNVYRHLLLAQTPDYGARARGIRQMLSGRNVLNICEELNVNSHHQRHVSERFNRTAFGAAYYASALFHLLRGEADVEMWWTATEDSGPYGLIDRDGTPTPVCYAKQLCTRHVRFGDQLSFPSISPRHWDIDLVVSAEPRGRRSAMLVHLDGGKRRFALSDEIDFPACSGSFVLKKIDERTGDSIVTAPYGGVIEFDGYGVAAVSNR